MNKAFEILSIGLLLASAMTPNQAVSDELITLTLSCEGEINIWANRQLVAKDSTFETTIEIQDNFLIGKNRIPLDVSNTEISRILGPNDDLEFMFSLNRLTGALVYHMAPKYTGTENTIQIIGKCVNATKLF